MILPNENVSLINMIDYILKWLFFIESMGGFIIF